MVSAAAIRHCIVNCIELLVTDQSWTALRDASAFVSLFAPAPLSNASRAALKVRARQHACAASPAECTRIARAIVAAKVKAEHHTGAAKKAFLAALKKAKTTDDVRHVEAQASQV
jgi:hypothetical protein